MSLAEQVKKVEAKFIVHTDMGYVRTWDKESKAKKDMDLCPTGARYVWLCSGGIWRPGDNVGVFFQNADRAARWWYFSLLDYAETVAPEDEWAKCHLWWREKPVFHSADYLAMRQQELLQESHPLAGQFTVTLGSVFSRLVITREGESDG